MGGRERRRRTLGRAQSLETLTPAPGDTPRALKIERLQKWSEGKEPTCRPTEAFNKSHPNIFSSFITSIDYCMYVGQKKGYIQERLQVLGGRSIRGKRWQKTGEVKYRKNMWENRKGSKIPQSSRYTHVYVHTWNADQVTCYLETPFNNKKPNISWTGDVASW